LVGLPDLVAAGLEDLDEGLRAGAFLFEGLRSGPLVASAFFGLVFDSVAFGADAFSAGFEAPAFVGFRAGALAVLVLAVGFLAAGALAEVAFFVVALVVFFVVGFVVGVFFAVAGFEVAGFGAAGLEVDFLATFFFEVVRLVAGFFDAEAFDPAFLEVVFREGALVVFFLEGDLLAAAFLATTNSRGARHLHLSL
jgi:hypothetical protein